MNDAVCDSSSPALTGEQSAHTEDFGTLRDRIAKVLFDRASSDHDYDWEFTKGSFLADADAVLDTLGLEHVGWMVWEDPQDSDSWVSVDLDFEDLIHYPHRPLFTVSLTGRKGDGRG